ncbi:MAG: nickel-dependent lactate racemase [Candidatus Bipolaricaulis sp.]|nr:nickel-dependent lactate racemase [Candidatus Bipolaricaulis sp.]
MGVRRDQITRAIASAVGAPEFVLAPHVEAEGLSVLDALRKALAAPTGTLPLAQLAAAGSRVLVLADDLTRPTPRRQLLPLLLDHLNEAGIPDENIEILIALGTHRPMTAGEIQEAFGNETVRRVSIVNHDFRDPEALVLVSVTPSGTPVVVNRRVLAADLVIGVGSIVPHPEAGWSGGAKILQPGVCGEETTAFTHMLAARQPDHLALAGWADNPVRLEIEQVAREGGLRFIINVVFDGSAKVVGLVAGDPVEAHRLGVGIARRIFVREIRRPVDVVVVDAHPADIDYWQGVKPLAFAVRAVRPGGTVVLVGDFVDGVSPIYGSELCAYGTMTAQQLRAEEENGRLAAGVCTEAMYLHAEILARARVVCVSAGLSRDDKSALGFLHAETVEDALSTATDRGRKSLSVGVILQGGDVLPALRAGGRS